MTLWIGRKEVAFTSRDAVCAIDHTVRLRGLPGLRESRALLLGAPVPPAVNPQAELALLEDQRTTNWSIDHSHLDEVACYSFLKSYSNRTQARLFSPSDAPLMSHLRSTLWPFP